MPRCNQGTLTILFPNIGLPNSNPNLLYQNPGSLTVNHIPFLGPREPHFLNDLLGPFLGPSLTIRQEEQTNENSENNSVTDDDDISVISQNSDLHHLDMGNYNPLSEGEESTSEEEYDSLLVGGPSGSDTDEEDYTDDESEIYSQNSAVLSLAEALQVAEVIDVLSDLDDNTLDTTTLESIEVFGLELSELSNQGSLIEPILNFNPADEVGADNNLLQTPVVNLLDAFNAVAGEDPSSVTEFPGL